MGGIDKTFRNPVGADDGKANHGELRSRLKTADYHALTRYAYSSPNSERCVRYSRVSNSNWW